MTDTMVRYFDSTMSGAPACTGQVGSLIGILDACLKDGFGSVTLTSLVVASNVATATVSGGHNFAMVGVNLIGPVIRIAGATPNGLNGDWRVTVTNSTTFTFSTTNVSDQTATGTITAKRAPAGFSKVYSGTNLAAYRADDTGSGSSQMYFRVDDTTTTYATVRGYESMSDINTGNNPFPTTTQISLANGRWCKSSTADSTARPWRLFADSRRFVLFAYWSDSSVLCEPYIFGDLSSYVTNDAYACMISLESAAPSSPGDYNTVFTPWNSPGCYFTRSYNQLGSSVAGKLIAPPNMGDYSYSNYPIGAATGYRLLDYPNAADNSLILWGECEYHDSATLRARLTGFYVPAQKAPLSNGDVVGNINGLSSRVLMAIAFKAQYDTGRVFVDLTSWQA